MPETPTDAAKPQPDYEYRVMTRSRWRRHERDALVLAGKIAPGWSEWTTWDVLITGRGQGRSFRKLGAAKGVITSQRTYPNTEREYRIQRRPVTTEWEDLPDAD